MNTLKLNICLVSTGYYPHDGGGIGTYIYNLARGLSAEGHKVVVITQTKENDVADQVDGIEVFRFKSRYYSKIEKFIPGLAWSFFVSKMINKLDQKYQFDVIEFPNWEGVGFAYLLRRKRKTAVVRLHTPYFETLAIDQGRQKIKWGDRFICWMEKQSCLKSDRMVSSTRCHKEMMVKHYDLDQSRVSILPLGIELDIKNYGRVNDKTGKSVKILYVSRLEHRKGTMVLLNVIPELLARHENIQFIIIGKDRPHAPLGRYHKEYFYEKHSQCKERVTFLGYVDNNELNDYYSQADIFVVPSQYESFGLIYVEAMMKGLAVIGTTAGGIPEVIKDGESGILVEPDNGRDLIRALNLLIANQELRDNLGTLAKEHARKEFNVEIMARRSVEHYRKSIAEFKSYGR